MESGGRLVSVWAVLLFMRSTTAFSAILSKPFAYAPPNWVKLSNVPPNGRLKLANLPTPLCRISTNGNESKILSRLQELGISLYIKRDDMTGGVELGGNKIRKLEFLLAEALAKGHDSVVTIGGEQSNHCRATAAAARMLGMEPHLILRTPRADAVHGDEKEPFGLTGNILFDRMVGSTIYTCTPGEYGRVGSDVLVDRVCQHLKQQGKKPYGIPVGGSNGVGSWGYINAVEEMVMQWNELHSENDETETIDHVVFACGSGGTAAGITLGLAECKDGIIHEQKKPPQVHAVGVCDDPDYFYNYVAGIAQEMGLPPGDALDYIKKHMIVHQGKGLGYASSTPEELDFCAQLALETGVALDPVYSGKALYHFVTEVLENDPEQFRNKSILFWHTGGALGMYDKTDELDVLERLSPVKRLDIYDKKEDGMVPI